MKILHFADVHLDRPFVGMPRDAARARRNDLRIAFQRCLAAARKHRADLVTIAGDLWEDEHVTADTRGFVAYEFERLGLPVLIACGNHDPQLPGGHYARTPWPDNVHLFPGDALTEFPLGDLSVWGLSWRGSPLSPAFLDTFHVPDADRTHLLLLHGTARTAPLGVGDDEYAPFEPAQIDRCGFALCLAGHIHAAAQTGRVVYPGSPEPLGWGDTGRHTVALIEAHAGEATVEFIDVNMRRYEQRRVDCGGATSSAEVLDRLITALGDPDPQAVCLRVDLVGQIGVDCQIDVQQLASLAGERYAALTIDDRTVPEFDLDGLAGQQDATGYFVRSLLNQIERATDERERDVLRLALTSGLHALNGRRDVLGVD
jgi:DNA repair protein SbcD/Mre11